MAYVIYQFGTLVLPGYDSNNDVGSGKFSGSLLDLPGGGVYDVLGDDRWKRRSTPISKDCALVTDTAADLRTQYNALRALCGKKARLWRLWDSGEGEWCWARMGEITAMRPGNQLYSLQMTLNFVMTSPFWYGLRYGDDEWFFTDPPEMLFGIGFVFGDTAPTAWTSLLQTLVLPNGGNAPVANAVITITAGTAAISLLAIASGDCNFLYTGTVAIGQSLVIDTGAWSVKNNGAADYAHLTLPIGHRSDDLFRLAAGDNTVEIGRVGGGTGSTIAFKYSEGWE